MWLGAQTDGRCCDSAHGCGAGGISGISAIRRNHSTLCSVGSGATCDLRLPSRRCISPARPVLELERQREGGGSLAGTLYRKDTHKQNTQRTNKREYGVGYRTAEECRDDRTRVRVARVSGLSLRHLGACLSHAPRGECACVITRERVLYTRVNVF